MSENGLEARLSAFVDASFTSFPLELYARSLRVLPLDTSTNSVFVLSGRGFLVHKNIVIGVMGFDTVPNNPATNELPFAVAILNAGLPESERITLPTEE